MKKYFIISVLFVLISTASSAQLRGIGDTTDIWHFARFEETPLYISIPDQTDNTWQIGPPQKEFFDQAYLQHPLSEASVIKLDQTYQRSHLIIYNSKGIPVKEETFSFLKEIPLGQINLSPGVYIVKMVVDDNTEAIRKVIVNQ